MSPLIVVEGIDNSGKSTLAERIAHRFLRPVQESEGPPTATETIDERIVRYMEQDATQPVVYARHPCVSQPIYAGIKGNRGDVVSPELIEAFYNLEPILIYCDPLDRGMSAHKIKEHDTPEFIADLESKYITTLWEYRAWAVKHAKIVWRIGDDEELLMQLVSSALRYHGRDVTPRRVQRFLSR
jgi:hypothetical protein